VSPPPILTHGELLAELKSSSTSGALTEAKHYPPGYCKLMGKAPQWVYIKTTDPKKPWKYYATPGTEKGDTALAKSKVWDEAADKKETLAAKAGVAVHTAQDLSGLPDDAKAALKGEFGDDWQDELSKTLTDLKSLEGELEGEHDEWMASKGGGKGGKAKASKPAAATATAAPAAEPEPEPDAAPATGEPAAEPEKPSAEEPAEPAPEAPSEPEKPSEPEAPVPSHVTPSEEPPEPAPPEPEDGTHPGDDILALLKGEPEAPKEPEASPAEEPAAAKEPEPEAPKAEPDTATAASSTPVAPEAAGAVPSEIPDVADLAYAGNAQHLGGQSKKHYFTDKKGRKYLFKTAKDANDVRKPWAAQAAELASSIQRKVLGKGVPVKVLSIGGSTGTIQPVMELGDPPSLVSTPPEKLTLADANAVAQEHVIDWGTGNHDGHGGQFIRLKDGTLVGIDKEQAFRFLGTPGEKLSTSYDPNPDTPYYNGFWTAFAAGKLPAAFDPKSAMLPALNSMMALPDAEYKEGLQAYFDSLPASAKAARPDFVEKALTRKASLKSDFEGFLTPLYRKKEGNPKGKFTFEHGWIPDGKVPKGAAPAETSPETLPAPAIPNPLVVDPKYQSFLDDLAAASKVDLSNAADLSPVGIANVALDHLPAKQAKALQAKYGDLHPYLQAGHAAYKFAKKDYTNGASPEAINNDLSTADPPVDVSDYHAVYKALRHSPKYKDGGLYAQAYAAVHGPDWKEKMAKTVAALNGVVSSEPEQDHKDVPTWEPTDADIDAMAAAAGEPSDPEPPTATPTPGTPILSGPPAVGSESWPHEKYKGLSAAVAAISAGKGKTSDAMLKAFQDEDYPKKYGPQVADCINAIRVAMGKPAYLKLPGKVLTQTELESLHQLISNDADGFKTNATAGVFKLSTDQLHAANAMLAFRGYGPIGAAEPEEPASSAPAPSAPAIEAPKSSKPVHLTPAMVAAVPSLFDGFGTDEESVEAIDTALNDAAEAMEKDPTKATKGEINPWVKGLMDAHGDHWKTVAKAAITKINTKKGDPDDLVLNPPQILSSHLKELTPSEVIAKIEGYAAKGLGGEALKWLQQIKAKHDEDWEKVATRELTKLASNLTDHAPIGEPIIPGTSDPEAPASPVAPLGVPPKSAGPVLTPALVAAVPPSMLGYGPDDTEALLQNLEGDLKQGITPLGSIGSWSKALHGMYGDEWIATAKAAVQAANHTEGDPNDLLTNVPIQITHQLGPGGPSPEQYLQFIQGKHHQGGKGHQWLEQVKAKHPDDWKEVALGKLKAIAAKHTDHTPLGAASAAPAGASDDPPVPPTIHPEDITDADAALDSLADKLANHPSGSMLGLGPTLGWVQALKDKHGDQWKDAAKKALGFASAAESPSKTSGLEAEGSAIAKMMAAGAAASSKGLTQALGLSKPVDPMGVAHIANTIAKVAAASQASTPDELFADVLDSKGDGYFKSSLGNTAASEKEWMEAVQKMVYAHTAKHPLKPFEPQAAPAASPVSPEKHLASLKNPVHDLANYLTKGSKAFPPGVDIPHAVHALAGAVMGKDGSLSPEAEAALGLTHEYASSIKGILDLSGAKKSKESFSNSAFLGAVAGGFKMPEEKLLAMVNGYLAAKGEDPIVTAAPGTPAAAPSATDPAVSPGVDVLSHPKVSAVLTDPANTTPHAVFQGLTKLTGQGIGPSGWPSKALAQWAMSKGLTSGQATALAHPKLSAMGLVGDPDATPSAVYSKVAKLTGDKANELSDELGDSWYSDFLDGWSTLHSQTVGSTQKAPHGVWVGDFTNKFAKNLLSHDESPKDWYADLLHFDKSVKNAPDDIVQGWHQWKAKCEKEYGPTWKEKLVAAAAAYHGKGYDSLPDEVKAKVPQTTEKFYAAMYPKGKPVTGSHLDLFNVNGVKQAIEDYKSGSAWPEHAAIFDAAKASYGPGWESAFLADYAAHKGEPVPHTPVASHPYEPVDSPLVDTLWSAGYGQTASLASISVNYPELADKWKAKYGPDAQTHIHLAMAAKINGVVSPSIAVKLLGNKIPVSPEMLKALVPTWGASGETPEGYAALVKQKLDTLVNYGGPNADSLKTEAGALEKQYGPNWHLKLALGDFFEQGESAGTTVPATLLQKALVTHTPVAPSAPAAVPAAPPKDLPYEGPDSELYKTMAVFGGDPLGVEEWIGQEPKADDIVNKLKAKYPGKWAAHAHLAHAALSGKDLAKKHVDKLLGPNAPYLSDDLNDDLGLFGQTFKDHAEVMAHLQKKVSKLKDESAEEAEKLKAKYGPNWLHKIAAHYTETPVPPHVVQALLHGPEAPLAGSAPATPSPAAGAPAEPPPDLSKAKAFYAAHPEIVAAMASMTPAEFADAAKAAHAYPGTNAAWVNALKGATDHGYGMFTPAEEIIASVKALKDAGGIPADAKKAPAPINGPVTTATNAPMPGMAGAILSKSFGPWHPAAEMLNASPEMLAKLIDASAHPYGYMNGQGFAHAYASKLAYGPDHNPHTPGATPPPPGWEKAMVAAYVAHHSTHYVPSNDYEQAEYKHSVTTTLQKHLDKYVKSPFKAPAFHHDKAFAALTAAGKKTVIANLLKSGHLKPTLSAVQLAKLQAVAKQIVAQTALHGGDSTKAQEAVLTPAVVSALKSYGPSWPHAANVFLKHEGHPPIKALPSDWIDPSAVPLPPALKAFYEAPTTIPGTSLTPPFAGGPKPATPTPAPTPAPPPKAPPPPPPAQVQSAAKVVTKGTPKAVKAAPKDPAPAGWATGTAAEPPAPKVGLIPSLPKPSAPKVQGTGTPIHEAHESAQAAAHHLPGGQKKVVTSTDGTQWASYLPHDHLGAPLGPSGASATNLFHGLAGFVKPGASYAVSADDHAILHPLPEGTKSLDGVPPSALSPAELQDVATEHVLDWAMGIHATHGGTLQRTPDGRIVGTAKTQPFVHDDQDKLSLDWQSPTSTKPSYYNKFWQDWVDGKHDFDPHTLKGAIESIESVDPKGYADSLRKHFEALHPGQPDTVYDRAQSALYRKAGVRADFERFLTDAYRQRTGKSKGFFTFDEGWIEAPEEPYEVPVPMEEYASSQGIETTAYQDYSTTPPKPDASKLTLKVPKSHDLTKLTDLLSKVGVKMHGTPVTGSANHMVFVDAQEFKNTNSGKTKTVVPKAASTNTPTRPRYFPKVFRPKPVTDANALKTIESHDFHYTGKALHADGPALEGQVMKVKKLSGKKAPEYQVSFKLREPYWGNLASGGASATFAYKQGTFDPATGELDHGKTKIDSVPSRKWDVGSHEAHFVTDPSQYAYKGTMVLHLKPAKGQTVEAALHEALEGVKPGLGADLLKPPSAEDKEVARLSRLLWAKAPQSSDQLDALEAKNPKVRTVAALKKRLAAANVSEEVQSRVVEREVYDGHLTHVLPGRAKSMGCRMLFQGIGDINGALNLAASGIMGIHERNLAGYPKIGGSYDADVASGSADGTLCRVATDAAMSASFNSHAFSGDYQAIIAPDELDRLDAYMYLGDTYGNCKKSSSSWTGRNTVEANVASLTKGHQSGNEISFRKGIHRNRILRIVTQSESSRKAFIDGAKARGITEVNGMPVEDYCVVGNNLGDAYNKYVKPLGY